MILLTGGDSGEGYAPLATTYAAVDFNGSGPLTIQGVTFESSHPNVSITGTIGTDTGALSANYAVTTANDTNLRTMGSTITFGISPSIQLTITGLAVGQTYQVDTFSGLRNNYSVRTMSLTTVGSLTLGDSWSIAQDAPNLNNFYDVRQTLSPDASGKITLTFTTTDLPTGATLNGLSVTTAPEPQPVVLLLAAGLLGLVACRKRRVAGWSNR